MNNSVTLKIVTTQLLHKKQIVEFIYAIFDLVGVMHCTTCHSTTFYICIFQYEKISVDDGLIKVSPLTGEVISNQPLDFETRSEISFQVRARADANGIPGNQERTSDAQVTIKLVDINDNFPQFEQEVSREIESE